MLAIHCCALQGRVNVMKLLLRFDTKQLIRKELSSENQVKRTNTTSCKYEVPHRINVYYSLCDIFCHPLLWCQIETLNFFLNDDIDNLKILPNLTGVY